VEQRKVTYQLYPTKKQQEQLQGQLQAHQRLYNAALEHRIWAYRSRQETVRFSQQCRELTQLRRDDPDYQKLNAQSCQVTLKRLDLAFQHFFRRVRTRKGKAGFPRFKSLRRFSGWGYKTHGDGWRLLAGEGQRNGKLRVSGVGLITIRGRARTPGTPKTMEIQHRQGKWYASVTLNCEPKRQKGRLAAGLDWGTAKFSTLAFEDGCTKEIENPRHINQAMGKLRKAQRNLSRKKRGSKNRTKARGQVARLHAQVANKRRDFLHKLSAQLIGMLALIATEKLNVKAMTSSARGTKEDPGKNVRQKAGLNRSILDTSPSAFLQLLRYKAEEAGVEWVEIPTRHVKPSQTCHVCGKQRRKSLSDRMHECKCGVICGRDENAARVMLAWALKKLSRREPAWCGGGSLDPPLKHETPPEAPFAQVV